MNSDNDNEFLYREMDGPSNHLTDESIHALKVRLKRLQSEVAQITKVLGQRSVGMIFDPTTYDVDVCMSTLWFKMGFVRNFSSYYLY